MGCFQIETENHVAIITFDNPPHNAIRKADYLEMRDVFASIGQQENVDVAILRSEGRFFCPGNDVSDFLNIADADDAEDYAQAVSDGIAAIYACDVPVIAAVHGHAFGAGMAMAACADVIVAAEDALFAIPEIKVGVIGAAPFLELIVPEKVSRYLSLTGDPISAKEIAAYGGIQKIVPREAVFDAAMDIARAMLKNSPNSLRYFKKAMNINQDARLQEKYAVETSFSKKLVGTDEAREAASAFLEKREAVFRR